jgi:hypothetical protein
MDMQALLAEFDSSGQTAGAFARSRGIAAWRIYNALQRRSGKLRARRRRAAADQALLPVRVVDAKPVTGTAGLELVLTGGHRVTLGPDFDVATLRRLFQALSSC